MFARSLRLMRQASVVGQALRLPNQKTAGDAPALQFRCAFHLSFVLRGVEIASRFRDKPIIIDLPKFVAGDPNSVSSSTGASVRSGKCPVKGGSVPAGLEFVERHGHIWKIAHESARDFHRRSRRSAI